MGSRIDRDTAAVLFEISKTILASRRVEATVALILEKALELTGAEVAGLLQLDAKTGLLRYTNGIGLDKRLFHDRIRLPIGQGVAGKAVAEGAPFCSSDVLNDPRVALDPETHEWVAHFGFRAVLAAPVCSDEIPVGALVVSYRQPYTFDDTEVEALSALASLASLALENSKLHEATAQRVHQLGSLNELTRRLSTLLDSRELGREILVAALALTNGAAGRFWQLVEGDKLRLVASVGAADTSAWALQELESGAGLVGIVAATRKPVTSRDLASDPRLVNKGWVESERLVSAALVPLVYDNKFYASMGIFTRSRHDFTEEELELLQSFAGQAAIALENARLYQEASRRREQAEAMAAIARATTSSLELSEILGMALEKVLEIMSVPAAIVYLREEATGDLRVAAHRGFSPAYIAGVDRVKIGEGALGRVVALGQPELIDDVQTSPSIVRPVVRAEGIRSVLIAPIQSRERVIGGVYVGTFEPLSFNAERLALLVAIGQQMAVAIENARLHGALLRSARQESEVRGRLDGIALAARELAHLLNNNLALPLGLVEMLRYRGDMPAEYQDILGDAAIGLENAKEHIAKLQQVVRIETKETPVGPALDLERSAQP